MAYKVIIAEEINNENERYYVIGRSLMNDSSIGEGSMPHMTKVNLDRFE